MRCVAGISAGGDIQVGTVEGDLQELERIVKDMFEERKVGSDAESMQNDESAKD